MPDPIIPTERSAHLPRRELRDAITCFRIRIDRRTQFYSVGHTTELRLRTRTEKHRASQLFSGLSCIQRIPDIFPLSMIVVPVTAVRPTPSKMKERITAFSDYPRKFRQFRQVTRHSLHLFMLKQIRVLIRVRPNDCVHLGPLPNKQTAERLS